MHRDVLTRHHAWDNGRRCVVKPGTLASVISLSKRQTQLLNQAARELGLEVVGEIVTKPGSALLVVCDYGEGGDVMIQADLKRLGITGKLIATNVETKEVLSISAY